MGRRSPTLRWRSLRWRVTVLATVAWYHLGLCGRSFSSAGKALNVRVFRQATRGPQVRRASHASHASHHSEGDSAGRQLLQWLEEQGAEVSRALDVVSDPTLGRELVVLREVEEGEELIKVPPEMCIPADDPQDDGDGEDVRLALAVLRVWDEEFWQAYRAVWPSESVLRQILPVHWPESRFQEFPSMPRLQAQVASRRQLLSEVAKRKSLDLERLTFAFDLVSTRAVGASIDACALIPGVDLANHGPKANTDLSVAGTPGLRSGRATVLGHGKIWEHGSAGLVAARDLAAGEAVRISYGKYPNQRFLLDYGFTLGGENPLGDEEKEHPNTGNRWEPGFLSLVPIWFPAPMNRIVLSLYFKNGGSD